MNSSKELNKFKHFLWKLYIFLMTSFSIYFSIVNHCMCDDSILQVTAQAVMTSKVRKYTGVHYIPQIHLKMNSINKE